MGHEEPTNPRSYALGPAHAYLSLSRLSRLATLKIKIKKQLDLAQAQREERRADANQNLVLCNYTHKTLSAREVLPSLRVHIECTTTWKQEPHQVEAILVHRLPS